MTQDAWVIGEIGGKDTETDDRLDVCSACDKRRGAKSDGAHRSCQSSLGETPSSEHHQRLLKSLSPHISPPLPPSGQPARK